MCQAVVIFGEIEQTTANGIRRLEFRKWKLEVCIYCQCVVEAIDVNHPGVLDVWCLVFGARGHAFAIRYTAPLKRMMH